MNPNLRTAVALVHDIAEEEAADAYDALFGDFQELRQELDTLRREVRASRRELAAIKRAVLEELERLREALG